MPNPLFGVGQLKSSKNPPDRPQPETPVVEHQYEGHVNPYRGIEDHGVASKDQPYEDYWGLEGRPVVIYANEPDDTTPVPVRIVTGDYSREYRRWRTDRRTADASIRQIVGKDDARKTVKVTNMDAAKIVYVAPNADDVSIVGYPLGPGKEMSLTAVDPVYAMSADGTAVSLGILVEFTVED